MHRNLLIITLVLVGSMAFAQEPKAKRIHSLPVEAGLSAEIARKANQDPNANPTPLASPAPPPTQPSTQSPAPDSAPSAQQPAASRIRTAQLPNGRNNNSGSEEIIPKMEFPNADVKEVLSFYERLTGARLVYDNTVQGTVNIVITAPVSQREAIQIIETNLLMNGFSLIPGSDNIIKVIGLTKNPRQAGVPIYSDAGMIPESDRVITFIFRLKYADPAEMIQMLQAGYVAPSNYTALTALPKSQSIMVTESTPVIRGLLRIIEQIDVPPAEVVSEFIPLQRADVKDVLEKLEKLFEKPQTQGGSAGTPGRTNPAAPAPGSAAVPGAEPASVEIQGGSNLSEDSVIVGKIKLTADVRTNRIHVITRPINLPFVRQLINDFDSNVPFAEPAKRILKFIPAGEMLDIVVKSIAEPGVKTEEGGAGATSKTGAKSSSTSSTTPSYGGMGGMGGYGGYGGYGGMGGMSSGIGGEGLSAEAIDTTPKAVTVGNTKIIADPRENSIIVLGNREVQSKVFALIDQIDVRSPQVMLNTVIGELSVNEDTNLGFDYILHTGGLLVGGSNSSLPSQTTGRGAGVTNFGGSSLASSLAQALGGSSGLTAVLGLGNSLDVVVHALQSTGRFKIIQRPMIFTSNNKKAVISSGESIAVQTQSLSNLVNTTTLNNSSTALNATYNYIPVELKLEVVPLINSDREVSLDILQTLNSVKPDSTNLQNPTITTRYLKTNVSVPNRGTVVLGGLIKRDVNNSISGIPVISKIPVLGYLFRTTTKSNDRSELVILIRPVVTRTPSETMFNSETEQQRMMIEPDLDSTLNNAGPTPKAVNGANGANGTNGTDGSKDSNGSSNGRHPFLFRTQPK